MGRVQSQRLTTFCGLALLILRLDSPRAQARTTFTPIARIDEASLGTLISYPVIESYDLDSTGKTVALLVRAGSTVISPLWLVIEDVVTTQVMASRKLGLSPIGNGEFAPQVVYSADERTLVVQDLDDVEIIDRQTLKTTGTVAAPVDADGLLSPLFVLGASGRPVFACAFGRPAKLNYNFHTTPARIRVVDIWSGSTLGEWQSDDVPQSISPDGALTAVSSSRAKNGILPVSVRDVHGQEVAELTAGLSLSHSSAPVRRALGLFSDSRELLLIGEDLDNRGLWSGTSSLQLASIDGARQIKHLAPPDHFRPTGEMAVSSDHGSVVVLSWYDDPKLLAREHARLPPSSPEALVFFRGAPLRLATVIKTDAAGLKATGWLENRRPRLSGDGSVFAMAQRGGVTVFRKVDR